MSMLDIPNDPIIQCILDTGYPPWVLDQAEDISDQVMDEFEKSLAKEIDSVDPVDLPDLKDCVIALNGDFYDYLAANGQLKFDKNGVLTFHGVEVIIVDYLPTDIMYEWRLKEVEIHGAD